jgi:hypothetical protein
MKLRIVPAQLGAQWVREGIRTFWRQPIALTGLFFIFMAVMSLSSLLPYAGGVLALALIPAATLGLMAAAREVSLGNFPMPTVLVSAFRAGQERKKDMAVLGVLYMLSFVGVLGLSALIDGGQFAQFYLFGGKFSPETVGDPQFQGALWLATALYIPLSAVFWHAPALVHWHGLPALKSMFFSLVACLSNWRAFLVFMLTWFALSTGVGIGSLLVLGLFDGGELGAMLLLPLMLLFATMFFTSSYFSFRDCFEAE